MNREDISRKRVEEFQLLMLDGEGLPYEGAERMQVLQHFSSQGEEAGFPSHIVDQAKSELYWLNRKADGVKAEALLGLAAAGHSFTLSSGTVPRAYAATYTKNAEGLWDQSLCESPMVANMEAAHLGFCVGIDALQKAVGW